MDLIGVEELVRSHQERLRAEARQNALARLDRVCGSYSGRLRRYCDLVGRALIAAGRRMLLQELQTVHPARRSDGC